MRNESVILPPYNYSDPGGTALGSAGMQKHALLKTMRPAHGTVHIVFLYMDGRQEHCRLEKRRRKFNKDPGIESPCCGIRGFDRNTCKQRCVLLARRGRMGHVRSWFTAHAAPLERELN